MRLAARILGAGDRFDELAFEAGLAYGLTGLLRNQAHHRGSGRNFLAVGSEQNAATAAYEHLARAKRLPKPGKAIAAFLPASLVPLYLRDPARDVPLHRRQLRFLAAALRGHV
jgi:phytoene/squalene synthetase